MLERAEIEKLMRDGAEAFLHGLPITACSYPRMSDRAATWRRGYQNAALGARFVTDQTAIRSIS